MYDLVAIGNPVYDEIVTPYVQSKMRVLSGCSTNACLAAKKLGLASVALIGCIGKNHEKSFKSHLSSYGVELPSVKISEKTGGFRLVYDALGNRTLDVLGIADKIFPEDIPKNCLDAKIILIAPILEEIDLKLISYLRTNSRATLFLDPQGMVRKIGEEGRIVETCDRGFAEKLTSIVDVIKPNEHESVTLTGFENPFTAARRLVNWGVELGIVTLAERGSIVMRDNGCVVVPAYSTFAKDPTGAGDTYAGAFITKYLECKPLLECGLFASATASIKVEYSGPDFPLTYEDATRRMNKLKYGG